MVGAMGDQTWRARCPHCGHPYIGRAFTQRQRDDPALFVLTLRPMLCSCGRTFVPQQVREWAPETL